MTTVIQDVLQDILDSAFAVLDPEPGLAVIAPGEVAWDDCCSGQVWVRVTNMSPKYSGGMKCPAWLTVNVEVGVIRCVAVLDDNGVAPTAAEITADAAQMIADASALYDVLQCLEVGAKSMLGDWTPTGPMSGCAGGYWAYTVSVPVPLQLFVPTTTTTTTSASTTTTSTTTSAPTTTTSTTDAMTTTSTTDAGPPS